MNILKAGGFIPGGEEMILRASEKQHFLVK